MSLPLKIKGKRVAKARNIELLEVPFRCLSLLLPEHYDTI